MDETYQAMQVLGLLIYILGVWVIWAGLRTLTAVMGILRETLRELGSTPDAGCDEPEDVWKA